MKWLFWRQEGSARIKEAQKALVETDLELLNADQNLRKSEQAKMSLREIRQANHFTQSIFPGGTK